MCAVFFRSLCMKQQFPDIGETKKEGKNTSENGNLSQRNAALVSGLLKEHFIKKYLWLRSRSFLWACTNHPHLGKCARSGMTSGDLRFTLWITTLIITMVNHGTVVIRRCIAVPSCCLAAGRKFYIGKKPKVQNYMKGNYDFLLWEAQPFKGCVVTKVYKLQWVSKMWLNCTAASNRPLVTYLFVQIFAE